MRTEKEILDHAKDLLFELIKLQSNGADKTIRESMEEAILFGKVEALLWIFELEDI